MFIIGSMRAGAVIRIKGVTYKEDQPAMSFMAPLWRADSRSGSSLKLQEDH